MNHTLYFLLLVTVSLHHVYSATRPRRPLHRGYLEEAETHEIPDEEILKKEFERRQIMQQHQRPHHHSHRRPVPQRAVVQQTSAEEDDVSPSRHIEAQPIQRIQHQSPRRPTFERTTIPESSAEENNVFRNRPIERQPIQHEQPQPEYVSPVQKSEFSKPQAPSHITQDDERLRRDFERKQAEGAKYAFSTDIQDHISDLSHSRKEVRDGLRVMGSYSYSDGYLKRTVHYVADENGYRITGEEAVPLENGPKVDLMGTASVDSDAHGTRVAYKVQSVPVPGPVAKVLNELERIE